MPANQKDYWNSLSGLDQDASIIDPNDVKGYKNAYIACLRDFYLTRYLKMNGCDGLVLDFGCGTGSATQNLLNNGFQVVGVDIAEGLIKQAKKRCNSDFVLIDGFSIPFKNNTFFASIDYVVLSYIVDNNQVVDLLREIRSSMCMGASFILIEQARSSRLVVENGLKVHRAHAEWIDLLQQAGFQITSSEVVRYGHFPFLYLIRFGLLPSFLWPVLMKLEWLIGKVLGCVSFDYVEVLYEVKA